MDDFWTVHYSLGKSTVGDVANFPGKHAILKESGILRSNPTFLCALEDITKKTVKEVLVDLVFIKEYARLVHEVSTSVSCFKNQLENYYARVKSTPAQLEAARVALTTLKVKFDEKQGSVKWNEHK